MTDAGAVSVKTRTETGHHVVTCALDNIATAGEPKSGDPKDAEGKMANVSEEEMTKAGCVAELFAAANKRLDSERIDKARAEFKKLEMRGRYNRENESDDEAEEGDSDEEYDSDCDGPSKEPDCEWKPVSAMKLSPDWALHMMRDCGNGLCAWRDVEGKCLLHFCSQEERMQKLRQSDDQRNKSSRAEP